MRACAPASFSRQGAGSREGRGPSTHTALASTMSPRQVLGLQSDAALAAIAMPALDCRRQRASLARPASRRPDAMLAPLGPGTERQHRARRSRRLGSCPARTVCPAGHKCPHACRGAAQPPRASACRIHACAVFRHGVRCSGMQAHAARVPGTASARRCRLHTAWPTHGLVLRACGALRLQESGRASKGGSPPLWSRLRRTC